MTKICVPFAVFCKLMPRCYVPRRNDIVAYIYRPIHHCRPAAKCELSLQFQDNDTSVTLILPRDISQPTSHPRRPTAVYFRRLSIANLYTVFMVARSVAIIRAKTIRPILFFTDVFVFFSEHTFSDIVQPTFSNLFRIT